MKRTDLQSKLSAALADGSLVRLTRKVETGAADGYVVGLSARWLVLLLVGDGIVYAGFQAFRLQDVSSVESPSPRAAFYEAVLRKREPRRPRVPELALGSAQELALSASRRFPLITIHREKADPEVCHIGQVVSASGRSLWLLEVDPDAVWDDAPTVYRTAEITRVDFGGRYEDALALVAGADPYGMTAFNHKSQSDAVPQGATKKT